MSHSWQLRFEVLGTDAISAVPGLFRKMGEQAETSLKDFDFLTSFIVFLYFKSIRSLKQIWSL